MPGLSMSTKVRLCSAVLRHGDEGAGSGFPLSTERGMRISSVAVGVWFLSISLFGCTATMSSLMQAIEKGDLQTARELLNSGADMNEGTQCNADMPEYGLPFGVG